MVLVTHRCWCSIEHAIPSELDRQARERGHTIYCPLGHQWVIRETELNKERRARQRFEQDNARLTEELTAAVQNRVKADRALVRHKKRASAGVCPCCTRTFSNMARHIKSEHPSYNVIPLKAAKA